MRIIIIRARYQVISILIIILDDSYFEYILMPMVIEAYPYTPSYRVPHHIVVGPGHAAMRCTVP